MVSLIPILSAAGFILGAVSLVAAREIPIKLEPSTWQKLFEPGKLDLTYTHREHNEEARHNAFLWTPVFKGGGGLLDRREQAPVSYGGGFFRPLAARPDLGDLILGAHAVHSRREDFEMQGEYRFPNGFGFGAGMVDTENPATDVKFGKLTYRQTAGGWSYILEVQAQEFGDTASLGGYAAVYNDQVMVVTGTDGEQWRISGGYIASENASPFRPAVEALYVDHMIGRFNGPRALFCNFTLGYKDGFLSHPARLGRAMGPQGLEFGNPLGFLAPTWNRRLEVWEMGGLFGARAERIELPDDTVTQRYEGLIFPFQFTRDRSMLDGFFVGAAYVENAQRATSSWLGGYFGGTDFVRGFAAVEHEGSPAETTLVLGLVFPL